MNNDQNCVNIKIFPTAELQFYLLKGKPSKKKNKKKCEIFTLFILCLEWPENCTLF